MTPLERPLTATGTSLSAFAPLPSCPDVPSPQAATAPLESSARLWRYPAEIAITPLSPLTCTGVSRFSKLPSPS